MLANTILHRAGGIVTGDVDPIPRAPGGSGAALDSRVQHLRRQHQLRRHRRHQRHGHRPQQSARRSDSTLGGTGRSRGRHRRHAARQASGDLRRRRPDARGTRNAEAWRREFRIDPHRRLDAADAKPASRSAERRVVHGSCGAGHRGVRRGSSFAAPAATDPRSAQRPDASRSRASSASRSILPAGDEFGELGDFFNTVSQQLSADRTLLAGQKANLQSAVEHLEDAVALFNPSGELLFSNPAMQHTLPADAIGRVLEGLLPNGHPYRTLVEETLATRKSRGPIQIQGHPTEQVAGAARSGDTGPDPRASAGTGPIVTKPEPKPGDDELVVTHAIAGTRGELVGVLLVSRNLAHLSRMQSTLAYSRKLVALGRLTAGIAHEVKNPLNAMMIHLELLRTKVRGLGDDVLQPEAGRSGGWHAGTRSVAGDSPSSSSPGRARARRDHRERNPPARRGRSGLPQVHATRGPAAAARPRDGVVRGDSADHRDRGEQARRQGDDRRRRLDAQRQRRFIACCGRHFSIWRSMRVRRCRRAVACV